MSDTIQLQRTRKLIKSVLETQAMGLTRVLLGLPIEHFFDRFKTLIQAEQQGFKQQIFQRVVKDGYIKGIFAGFSSSMTIQICKQYYRWPMMIFVPKFYSEKLNLHHSYGLHKIMAGATIAVFESILTCPFERTKCQLMTQQKAQAYFRNLLRSEASKFQVVKSLYTGLEIMMMKQVVSWTNYLFWDHQVRHWFKESPSQSLSALQCLKCSFIAAVPNVVLVQPFDTLKTLYQMEKNQQYKSLTIIRSAQQLYTQQGIMGFYAGWRVRVGQFVVQSIMTTPLMDYLERMHGLPKN